MSLSKDAKPGGIQVGSLQSVPDRLKCTVCTFVLRDPVQGVCGHRYCKVCIVSAGVLCCIECQKEGEEDVPRLSADSMNPDKGMMRELNKTEFHCPWEPQCNVRMKLPELMKHAESECSHRRDIAAIQCDLKCGKMLPASEMENHKTEECPMKPRQCEICQEFVPQDQMEKHRTSACINNMKKGKSCTARVKDKDEDKGNHNMNHESQARLLGSVRTSRVQVSDPAVPIEQQETASQSPDQLLEQVSDKIILGELINCILRYGLPHSPNQTRETREQQEFFARISFAFTADRALEKELISMDRKLKDAHSSVDQLSTQMQQQLEELIKASDTYSVLLRAMAMKEIRICELDRKISMQELGSTDGTLVWKIPFFRERLSDAEYEPIVPSPILYAEKFGYKLSAVAYLNGHNSGRGTHLSLFARLLQGPYDAAQRWPFRRTVTFTLMDQSGPNHLVREFKPDQSSQFQRPSQPMGQMFGFGKFALKDELESKGFLKDDTLFVKLQVSKPTLSQRDF